MLQVTFRNLLPSECLIALAQREYRRLHANSAAHSSGMFCSVTIDKRPGSEPDYFRVRVQIMRGRKTALSAVSEGADAQIALRTGLAAATGLAPISLALRARLRTA